MPPEAPKNAPAPAKEAPASGKAPSGYEL